MNKIIGVLLFLLPVLMCSCDEKKEPVLHNSYRISHIECDQDNYRQICEYNEKGLVSKWEEQYDDPEGKVGITSSYEYSDDNKIIKISSDELLFVGHRRVFSETLYLNANGTAQRAEGSVVIYHSQPDYELSKLYTVEFQYDSLNQLTDISISEKRSDFAGQEEQKSLDWFVEIGWNEGNMSEYSEYYTSVKGRYLMAKTTYSYYGNNFVDYKPILNKPILRYFYLPLQYQGMLGKQSYCLVKRETISETYLGEEKSSYNLDYSYDISTSIHDSRIESFNCVRSYDGEDLKYVVGWELE